MLALGSLPCLAFGVDERIGLFVGKIDVTTRHLILLTHVSHSKPVCCQRMTHAWTLSILMSFIQVDGLVQTPDDDYTIDTGTNEITFTSAPATSAEIVVVATGTAQDANSAEITAIGSTTTRSLADRFADGLFDMHAYMFWYTFPVKFASMIAHRFYNRFFCQVR